MSTQRELLIIDPQNDFCDIAGAALPVTGADADLRRLADFVAARGDGLAAIRVTLDSHQPLAIAHPAWWQDAAGNAPAPFTPIAAADVEHGRWRARDPAQQERSRAYVAALAANDRYQLLVWPEHCLIGSWGHNIHAGLKRALDAWSRTRLRPIDYLAKGSNPGTEHYSALQAEVPDPADPATQPNERLLAALAAADLVVIAGEALSHCVANTVRDLAGRLPAAQLGKLVLLTDCCSPVPGCERLGSDFIAEMQDRGLRTARSTDALW